MATLRANGPELLRVSHERQTPDDKSVSWRRKTIVYHTNGAVLVKNDVRFRPTFEFDPPNGRFYSWGWKKAKAVKDNPNPVETAKNALRVALRDSWTIEFTVPEINVW